jgi:hypothetical protein
MHNQAFGRSESRTPGNPATQSLVPHTRAGNEGNSSNPRTPREGRRSLFLNLVFNSLGSGELRSVFTGAEACEAPDTGSDVLPRLGWTVTEWSRHSGSV